MMLTRADSAPGSRQSVHAINHPAKMAHEDNPETRSEVRHADFHQRLSYRRIEKSQHARCKEQIKTSPWATANSKVNDSLHLAQSQTGHGSPHELFFKIALNQH